MEFEDKFKYTKVFEFLKELTKISTPKLPILFLDEYPEFHRSVFGWFYFV